MHVFADAAQLSVVRCSRWFHTFVHRLCMCNTGLWEAGRTGLQQADLFLFSQVRAGFRNHRQEVVDPEASSGKLTPRSRERPDANKDDTRGSTGCPQGIPGCVASTGDGFVLFLIRAGLTLSSPAAYRCSVEPVSTGAACPRSLPHRLCEGV